jgi:hypothetical protein
VGVSLPCYHGVCNEASASTARTRRYEFERFDIAVRKMFTVSKEDVLKVEAKRRRARAQKKQAKKTK